MSRFKSPKGHNLFIVAVFGFLALLACGLALADGTSKGKDVTQISFHCEAEGNLQGSANDTLCDLALTALSASGIEVTQATETTQLTRLNLTIRPTQLGLSMQATLNGSKRGIQHFDRTLSVVDKQDGDKSALYSRFFMRFFAEIFE
jgi:hypothetical protein